MQNPVDNLKSFIRGFEKRDINLLLLFAISAENNSTTVSYLRLRFLDRQFLIGVSAVRIWSSGQPFYYVL